MQRAPEPEGGTEQDLLLGWLAFHRDALAAKCEGVSPQDLIRSGLGGSPMSLLGLVRHLTEMERVYFTYSIGGGELEFVYGPYEDDGPAGDFDNLTVDMVAPSFEALRNEQANADRLIAAQPSLDTPGAPGRRNLRENLLKVIQEYARHNGHADIIRESIDGATGE
ncbi:MAG: DinB family protein [Ilumatobacteraceae bacterium]